MRGRKNLFEFNKLEFKKSRMERRQVECVQQDFDTNVCTLSRYFATFFKVIQL